MLAWTHVAGIRPWEHYIPVRHDLSDIHERLAWARDHDDEVLAMVRRANDFAYTYLQTDYILLYFRHLLEAYAAKSKV